MKGRERAATLLLRLWIIATASSPTSSHLFHLVEWIECADNEKNGKDLDSATLMSVVMTPETSALVFTPHVKTRQSLFFCSSINKK